MSYKKGKLEGDFGGAMFDFELNSDFGQSTSMF
jgi:hypothetical protein